MGNVLRMDKQQQIHALAGLGWSNHAISRETGIDRKTISRYRKRDVNQPEVPADSEIKADQNPPKVPTDPDAVSNQNPPEVPADLPPPSTHSSTLQVFTGTVRTMFMHHLTAQRIYQDLVEEHAYKGSYDSVKRYVRKLRKRIRHFTERLPHLPGREAQVDFGKAPCRVKIDGVYKRVMVVLSRCPLTLCPTGIFTSWDYILQFIL